MNNLSLNIFIASFRSCLLLVIFLFSLSNGVTLAQKKDSKKKKTLEAEFGLATFYDDNILKYSEKYLERFLNNKDEGRFHINTYDDLVLKPSAQLLATFNIFKKQKSKIDLNYSYSAYLVNSINNWSLISLGFQQYLTRRASFKISYTYIPEFYVRHFRDKDLVKIYGYTPETFVPFSFSKDNYGFWIQNTFFKNTRIKLAFDYAKYYHNKHYTEYDCKNFSYGIQIFQNIMKKLRIDVRYEYGTSDAKGYDSPDETKETSDDADADNVGEEFAFGIDWQLPSIFKHDHDLDFGITYGVRYYTTDKYVEDDPEHAGRIDNNLYIRLSYIIKMSKSMDLSAFYKWYGRDSKTTSDLNSVYVSEEKDYRQNQVGLAFTWKFKL